MKKWEYRILDYRDIKKGTGLLKGPPREEVEAYMATLGNEGWEIVNLHFNHFEFQYSFYGVAKREIQG